MQILPPLVPPASTAALLGSTATGPACAALAVVPVHLLVILAADEPCGQHTACHGPGPDRSRLWLGQSTGFPAHHGMGAGGGTVSDTLRGPHQPQVSMAWAAGQSKKWAWREAGACRLQSLRSGPTQQALNNPLSWGEPQGPQNSRRQTLWEPAGGEELPAVTAHAGDTGLTGVSLVSADTSGRIRFWV